jgi:hypothetical protein
LCESEDSGSFVTVDGTSAGNKGHVDAGVTGTIEGGYNAILAGSFKSDTIDRAKGNIGSKDYGCTINSSGQVNAGCPAYSWVSSYFNVTSFVQGEWGWTYDAGDNGTWVNASTGNIGDITSP